MKRIILLLIALILIVVLFLIVFIAKNKQMIRGSAKDLDKVIITIHNYSVGGYSERIDLETAEELDEIFTILKDTQNVQYYRYADEIGMQHDRKFDIQLYYSSGRIEIIGATEISGSLYRDQDIWFVKGFLIGKNELIWDYISVLDK